MEMILLQEVGMEGEVGMEWFLKLLDLNPNVEVVQREKGGGVGVGTISGIEVEVGIGIGRGIERGDTGMIVITVIEIVIEIEIGIEGIVIVRGRAIEIGIGIEKGIRRDVIVTYRDFTDDHDIDCPRLE